MLAPRAPLWYAMVLVIAIGDRKLDLSMLHEAQPDDEL